MPVPVDEDEASTQSSFVDQPTRPTLLRVSSSASIFPNSRKDNDNGFENSSRMLERHRLQVLARIAALVLDEARDREPGR